MTSSTRCACSQGIPGSPSLHSQPSLSALEPTRQSSPSSIPFCSSRSPIPNRTASFNSCSRRLRAKTPALPPQSSTTGCSRPASSRMSPPMTLADPATISPVITPSRSRESTSLNNTSRSSEPPSCLAAPSLRRKTAPTVVKSSSSVTAFGSAASEATPTSSEPHSHSATSRTLSLECLESPLNLTRSPTSGCHSRSIPTVTTRGTTSSPPRALSPESLSPRPTPNSKSLPTNSAVATLVILTHTTASPYSPCATPSSATCAPLSLFSSEPSALSSSSPAPTSPTCSLFGPPDEGVNSPSALPWARGAHESPATSLPKAFFSPSPVESWASSSASSAFAPCSTSAPETFLASAKTEPLSASTGASSYSRLASRCSRESSSASSPPSEPLAPPS